MIRGATLDTGALIAFERRKPQMRRLWTLAIRGGIRLTIPAAVVAEWYRGPSRVSRELFASCWVEPLTAELARVAGLAQATVFGATAVDAIVVASAAQRGDVIYTSDPDDLEELRGYFRAVASVCKV